MDLDDLLEDLLEDAGKAARRQVRAAGQVVGGKARRGARRAVRTAGAVTAVSLLVLAIALLAIGDPGGIRIVLAALALTGAAGSGALAAMAQAGERKDPVTKAQRARRAGKPLPPSAVSDVSVLPKDIRGQWLRMLEARTLVGDMAAAGWVHGTATLELDDDIARLHRLLVADRRSEKVGGRATPQLRTQVHDLADLLVALADEAVEAQAESHGSATRAAATLQDARDNLASLRSARRAVREVERRATGEG